MATGFVFVYLAIAALVAPFVWLVWWALDSTASSRVPAPALARRPAGAGPAYVAPRAVDLPLPGHRATVTVYSMSGKELSTCPGPDAGGHCSRPLADGTVPCAGCLLALPTPIRGSLDWEIPAGYQACLMGGYGALRQAGPAR